MAKTVLVVDDDPTQRRLIQAVLERDGFAVAHAQNGDEAIQHLSAGAVVDVVLLDLVMPGLSGFDLLRAARSAASRPRAVIAVSSYNEFRHKAMDMGFDSFVAKPVELAKLRPLLEGLQPTA